MNRSEPKAKVEMNQILSVGPSLLKKAWPIFSFFGRRSVIWADFLFALFFLTLMCGVIYGSTDDMFIIPGVYQLENSHLYQNDLAFRQEKGSFNYHDFGRHVLFALSRLMPIEYSIFLSIIFWQFVLLVGLKRLVKQVSGKDFPAIGIALLIFCNPHLTGYNLTGNWYAIHFAALALSLLSLSFFIEQRWKSATVLLLFATAFHPLIGSGTMIFVASCWFFQLSWRTKKTVLVVTSLGGALIFLACVGIYWESSIRSFFVEIALIKVFVRGPWHLSPEYWGNYEVLNFYLIIFILFIIFKTAKGFGTQLFSFAALIVGAIIWFAILNNYNRYFFEPLLVFMNPFELGPIVLAILYVLSISVVMEWVEKKYFLSTLTIFILLALQAWFLFLVFLICINVLSRRFPDMETWKKDLGTLISLIGGVALMFQLFEREWVNYVPESFLFLRFYVFLLAAAAVFLLIKMNRYSMPAFVVVLSLSYLLVTAQMGRLNWFQVNMDFEKDWVELCDFAKKNTEIDSTFIIPPEMYTFQYLSKRAAFFNFKHFPAEVSRIQEWYKRAQILRLLSPVVPPNQIFGEIKIHYDNYNFLSEGDFKEIKHKYPSTNFCVVRNKINLSLPVLFENQSYRIYVLSPDR